MGVKLVCAAAVALIAVGQLSQWPLERRAELWAKAGITMGFAGSRSPGVASAPVTTPQPVSPVRAGLGGSETIHPDRYGQFHTYAEVDGQRFPVMVDTGAAWLCLTYDDADRLGFRPLPSDFSYPLNTANGRQYYARVDLRDLRIGSVVIRDVSALVAPRGALWLSLLGMNVLKRLSSFEVDGGSLVMRQ